MKRAGARTLAARPVAPSSDYGPDVQTVRFEGRLAGLNDMLRAKRTPRGRGADAYYLERRRDLLVADAQIRGARLRPVSRVRLSFEWIEADRRRDPDNFCAGGRKLILDALVAAAVLQNDGWSQVVGWVDTWRTCEPGEKPGCLLTIERVRGEGGE